MEIAETSGDRLMVSSDKWLSVLREEYLSTYIRFGGSAVKVISGSDEHLCEVQGCIREMALNEGYYCAELNPAELDANGNKQDLHRIEKFFLAVTKGVDWKGWTAAQTLNYLASRGVYVRDGRALNDLEGIASDNGREASDLLNQFEREFATRLIKDHTMTIEFRAAITALGRAQLVPDSVTPTTEEVLLAWLGGQTMPGAATALKKIQVFERINKTNARYMLASFCRWLPQVGYKGLVVILDFRPYEHKKKTKSLKQEELLQRVRDAVAQGATNDIIARIMAEGDAEPAVSYSDTAYMQMLAMIRHFIDEIDWFERMLLVILTSPKFYDHDESLKYKRRTYTDYNALQTRIGLEIHDARKANPAAALVHLGDSA